MERVGANNNNANKIFVGGLHPDTTEEDLSAYFGNFGVVSNSVVKRDPSNRSRGFGFVTFSDTAVVKRVLADENHIINNKKIDPKPAQPVGSGGGGGGFGGGSYGGGGGGNFGMSSGASNGPQQRGTGAKVFVGGVDASMQEDEIRTAMSAYGAVSRVEWPFDKQRQVRKNYAFVEFDTAATAESCLAQGDKVRIGDRLCDIRKATPQQQNGYGAGGGGSYGGGMGGGGYGGNRGGGYGGNRGGPGGGMGGGMGDMNDPYAQYWQGFTAYGGDAYGANAAALAAAYGNAGMSAYAGMPSGAAGVDPNAAAQMQSAYPYANYNAYQAAYGAAAAGGDPTAAASMLAGQYGASGYPQAAGGGGYGDQTAAMGYGQQQQAQQQWGGQQAGAGGANAQWMGQQQNGNGNGNGAGGAGDQNGRAGRGGSNTSPRGNGAAGGAGNGAGAGAGTGGAGGNGGGKPGAYHPYRR